MVCSAPDVTLVWQNGLRLSLNDRMDEGLLSNPGSFFFWSISNSQHLQTFDYITNSDRGGRVYFKILQFIFQLQYLWISSDRGRCIILAEWHQIIQVLWLGWHWLQLVDAVEYSGHENMQQCKYWKHRSAAEESRSDSRVYFPFSAWTESNDSVDIYIQPFLPNKFLLYLQYYESNKKN